MLRLGRPLGLLSRRRAIDIALTNLSAGDILFIDEIHRLSPAIEEVLYPAMEDFRRLTIGEGPAARSIKIDLPLYPSQATTELVCLLLARWLGIAQRLEFYRVKDLTSIVVRSARLIGVHVRRKVLMRSRRSRGP